MAQVKTRPPSFSTPLPGATLYHPGGKLIVALVFVPFLATSAAAAYFLSQGGAIPLWLPAALVVWGALTPVFWRILQTLRVSPAGIAAGRPWQAWREIEWTDIARVAQHGMRLHVVSSQGMRLKFTPALLHDGLELRRNLLVDALHMAPEGALEGPLLAEVIRLTMGDEEMPDNVQRTQAPGIQRMRPRRRWRLGMALGALLALTGGVLALVALPPVTGLPVAAVAMLVAVVCVVAFCWLSQQVALSDGGFSVQRFPSGRPHGMLWSEVVVLEHTEGWAAIRLTGATRIAAPGPRVMNPLDARVYTYFLRRRLRERENGVLEARRHWLL